MLVCDWAQTYYCARSEASIYRAAFVIFLYEFFICKLDCSPYMSGFCCRRAFFEKSFQFLSQNKAPKFTLPTLFDPLVSQEKKFKNLQTLKCEKIFPAGELTSMPSRRKQTRTQTISHITLHYLYLTWDLQCSSILKLYISLR